jgi:glycosyltransferase involved in cell wall biosynthesis
MTQKYESITAVVVTYNRKQLLVECIAALAKQSLPVGKIIIVDNASTDHTEEYLHEQGVFSADSNLIYLRLATNIGGAGGFYEGLQRAMALGSEWIWVMDDDSIPERDALAALLTKQSEFTAVKPYLLASKVLWTDQTLHSMNIPSLKTDEPELAFYAARHEVLSIRSTSFVAMLIHRSLVEKYGYPIKDYFIWNDDYEYSARILRHEFGVAVPASLVCHKTLKKHIPVFDSGGRYFYEVRNKLWMLLRTDSWNGKEKIIITLSVIRGIFQYLGHGGLSLSKLSLVIKGLSAGFFTAPRSAEVDCRRRGDKTNKKKILYITVRADLGGGPAHLLTLIEKLHKQYDLSVACPQEKPYWDQYCSLLGEEKLIAIPHRKFSLRKFWQLHQYITAQQIEIVHSHGKGAGLYSRLLKLGHPRLKIVHTLHGIHYQQYGRLARAGYFRLERWLARLTDRFINVSQGEQDEAVRLKLYARKQSQVIYNGITIDQLKLDQFKKPAGFLPDDFVVLNISRFDYQKNIELLIECAKVLNSQDQQIKFLLVGDGPERVKLERSVRQAGLTNVSFVGFQENALKYFTLADLCLSTARWEGLPISLIESLAMGVPIVATDVVGNNEVVVPEENGLLYPLGDYHACAEAILRLKNDRLLLKRFGAAAGKLYEEKFQAERMINKTAAVYDTL